MIINCITYFCIDSRSNISNCHVVCKFAHHGHISSSLENIFIHFILQNDKQVNLVHNNISHQNWRSSLFANAYKSGAVMYWLLI